MLIYLLSFSLTLLITKIYLTYKKKHQNNFKSKKVIDLLFMLAIIFPFWFISAFRYNVGTDYLYTYVKYYEHTKIGWLPYKTEPLFQLINSILVWFNLDVVWLFIITSFVILFFIFIIIFKCSENIYLSIIIFFVSGTFFNTLNNVRQYMSLAIAYYGLLCSKNKRGILWIIVASLIHTSSIVLIIPFFLKNNRLNRKKYLYINIFGIVFSPLICMIMRLLLLKTKYSYFFAGNVGGYSLLFILLNIFMSFLIYIYYDNNSNMCSFLAIMQTFTLIFCVCSMIIQNEEFWMRVIRIFCMGQFLLIPSLIKTKRNTLDKAFICFGSFAAFFVYSFYTIYLMGGLEVFPYRFIF